MSTEILTAERLRELLHYDPLTGLFTWKLVKCRWLSPGDLAGSMRHDGYRVISLDGRLYRAHRLAWLYMTGSFPPADTDHINRIRNDNRFANLRLATRAENHQNRTPRKQSKSGYNGIVWIALRSRWEVSIMLHRREIYIGRSESLETAIAMRKAAELKYHPFATS